MHHKGKHSLVVRFRLSPKWVAWTGLWVELTPTGVQIANGCHVTAGESWVIWGPERNYRKAPGLLGILATTVRSFCPCIMLVLKPLGMQEACE